MKIPRRQPRQVYRVYDEREFFAREDWTGSQQLPGDEDAQRPRGYVRARRLAGAVALFGALGAVGGAMVVAGLRPSRGSRRAQLGGLRARAQAPIGEVARVRAQPHPATARSRGRSWRGPLLATAHSHSRAGSIRGDDPPVDGASASSALADSAHPAAVTATAGTAAAVAGTAAAVADTAATVAGTDVPSADPARAGAQPAGAIEVSSEPVATKAPVSPAPARAEFGFER
jgi:hypothetical protein